MSVDQINLPDDEQGDAHSSKLEDSGRNKKTFISGLNWRLISAISSILALLLAIGLSVALGIFLRKTECGPPPRHLQATTNYLGSAAPGTEIIYSCPRPLVFPNNEVTFPIQCKDRLYWNVTDIPACGRDGEKHCNGLLDDKDFNLSLVVKDEVTKLMVELTLQGQVPSCYLLDVDSRDESKCVYGTETNKVESPMLRESFLVHRPPLLAMKSVYDENRRLKNVVSTPIYIIKVTDTVVNPELPYEILIRGSGDFLALTLQQEAYLNITFHEIDLVPPPSTTPLPSVPTEQITSTVVYPTTSKTSAATTGPVTSATSTNPEETTSSKATMTTAEEASLNTLASSDSSWIITDDTSSKTVVSVTESLATSDTTELITSKFFAF